MKPRSMSGGLDNVDASVFEGFDYVALGHIHKKTADRAETRLLCRGTVEIFVW